MVTPHGVPPHFEHDRAGTPAEAWAAHPGFAAGPVLTLVGTAGRSVDRVVVLAAHPDDESLGAAGLMAAAHEQGIVVEVVLATSGEHSHPASPSVSPGRLAVLRRAESEAALQVVAPGARVVDLGIEDGQVAAHEERVVTALVESLGDARDTLLVSPWRHDGHPDHEAAGRAAAVAARRTGARHLEYPIWLWHWGTPDQVDWSHLHRLPLAPDRRAAKQRSVAAHRTQVAPLSDRAGDEVLLGPGLLAHFAAPVEHFFGRDPDDHSDPDDPAVDRALDDLHRASKDPWGVDTRWFEARKRRLVMAMLPRARFLRGLELGCSTGALAAELAGRCEELLALDASASAVASAQRRLGGRAGVTVERRDLPGNWPEGRFDLVVLSEVGYFLSPVALDAVLERIEGCLSGDGVALLCHWRHPVHGWVLDGPDVHHRFRERFALPELATYVDPDVAVSVFCARGQWPHPTT